MITRAELGWESLRSFFHRYQQKKWDLMRRTRSRSQTQKEILKQMTGVRKQSSRGGSGQWSPSAMTRQRRSSSGSAISPPLHSRSGSGENSVIESPVQRRRRLSSEKISPRGRSSSSRRRGLSPTRFRSASNTARSVPRTAAGGPELAKPSPGAIVRPRRFSATKARSPRRGGERRDQFKRSASVTAVNIPVLKIEVPFIVAKERCSSTITSPRSSRSSAVNSPRSPMRKVMSFFHRLRFSKKDSD